MLAICSDTYFDREKGYSRAERQSMFWEDPTNNEPLLILVKVSDCKFPRLIAQNEYISLIGMQRPEAAAKLVGEQQTEKARKASQEAQKFDRSRALPTHFNVQGAANPMFTGRDAELALLHERVKSGGATAITAVQGMGGIGKTSLAREYAHRFGTAARFGGVWWIEAETQSSILASYDQLAEHLATTAPTPPPRDGDQAKTAGAVRDWLGQQPDTMPWLIIFDNATDDETVAPWLPKGSAKVIITTRYAGFETIAEPLSLNFWDKETTARFLQIRTDRGSNAEALSLAKRLDGLPLAAEQARAYLRKNSTLSFAAYEARLIQMLDQAPRALPGAYDKSLYATFRTALEAVSERPNGAAALAILNICAFLSPDGVELDMLKACASQTEVLPEPPKQALADEVRCAEAVKALSAYSLVRIGDAPGWGQTLVLHRLLGDIARDLLSDEQHIKWSEAAVLMIHGLMPTNAVNTPAHWPLHSRLAPHVRALLPLDPEAGNVGKALGFLINESGLYLSVRGDLNGAIILLRRRVEIREIIYKDDPTEIAIALSNLAGHLGEHEATRDEAEAAYARALEIEEAVLAPDDPSLAVTLSNIGVLHSRRSDYAKEADFVSRSANIVKAAYGIKSTQYATILNNLGAIYSDWAQAIGDVDLLRKERDAKEESTRITQALRGMRHPETTARQNNLAVISANAGDVLRASNYMALAEAIDLSLDQDNHHQTHQRIADLIHLWTVSDQPEKADRLKAGDPSDLIPIVVQIEAVHRAWVAEDPENRQFGPPSPVTGATE